MKRKTAGFREIEHTADWELEVWAPDILELLKQAALGMFLLSGAKLSDGPRVMREFEVTAVDPEGLLVSFLSELLYYGEREGLGFDRFELSLEGEKLWAQAEGAPFVSLDKEIKAVTYHNLEVRHEPGGLLVRIVFDV